ncbi:MAG: GtrA family protein [Chloroflexota bacterium]
MQQNRRQALASQAWDIGLRFQKYLVVGIIGLAVNQGLLMLLVSRFGVPVAAASPPAIVVSIVVTFVLNESWTWHDRGTGRAARRAMAYAAINGGGLAINWAILVWLHRGGIPYEAANLVGAAVAALSNFTLNNAITWREAR